MYDKECFVYQSCFQSIAGILSIAQAVLQLLGHLYYLDNPVILEKTIVICFIPTCPECKNFLMWAI